MTHVSITAQVSSDLMLCEFGYEGFCVFPIPRILIKAVDSDAKWYA